MTISSSPSTSAKDTDDALRRLREIYGLQLAAQLAGGAPSAAVRRNRIDRFMLGILENADELVAALDEDFGSRPELFSFRAELTGMMPAVEHAWQSLEKWMAPESVPSAAERGIPTFIQKTPKGVVGIIGPWNFPIQLTAQPAVEALAAGNRVMIKFSEVPSRTAEVFARAIATRMDPSEVAVVLGGAEVAAAFSDLSFDHLFFTGSPGVGRRVAEAAGRNLVPVTLELGGKNPVVISSNADLSAAAERIMGTRMINGGQLCLCPDYVFVPSDRVDDFVDEYCRHMTERFPEYATSDGVVSSVNPANFARVQGLVTDARDNGATVVSAIPEEEASRLTAEAGRRVGPVVILNATDDMRVTSEEIFGPVIVVYPYDTVDEAIGYINSRPRPLAAYWYGDDDDEYRRFLDRTASGGVTRNDMALHLSMPDVPFGGIGQSGSGYYHGRAGFDTFTHLRAVAASELPSSMSRAATPPYTAAALDGERETVRNAIDAFSARIE
jgi:coniferyl-aldehyde dehydrogenase